MEVCSSRSLLSAISTLFMMKANSLGPNWMPPYSNTVAFKVSIPSATIFSAMISHDMDCWSCEYKAVLPSGKG